MVVTGGGTRADQTRMTPMFRLPIGHPPPLRGSAPDANWGHAYHVTEARWTHTSHDTVDQCAGETAPIRGRAVIHGICGCQPDADIAVPRTNCLRIGDGELRKVDIERLWAR